MAQQIVVVGGGYGGTAVAKALDALADVVLVEAKDAFHHNAASLRSVVRPDFLPRTFYSYEQLLERGRVVNGIVTAAEPDRVTLASGEQIPASFLVLATGSRYPFPAKSSRRQASQALADYSSVNRELAAAARVLLLGAGPVGLEFAGEIRAQWPDKQITLIDPAGQILARYDAGLRAEITRQLGDLGIRLSLGTRLRAEPTTEPGRRAEVTATTVAGETVTADIWFRCFGGAPVTDYLAGSLRAARLPGGQIEVTESLAVAGHDTVYAIGDITSVEEAKQAGAAIRHAEVVAANIRAAVTGEGDRAVYQPGDAILLPLGPAGGASQLPGVGIVGAEVTAQHKGADLMTGRFDVLFGKTAVAGA